MWIFSHCTTVLQVVLLSELGCPAEAEQLELIIQMGRVSPTEVLHTCKLTKLVTAVNKQQGMKTMDTIELVHIGPDWTDSEVKLEQRDDAGGGSGESFKGGSGSQDTSGGGGGGGHIIHLFY